MNFLRRGHRIARPTPGVGGHTVHDDERFEVLETGALTDDTDWDRAMVTEIGAVDGGTPDRH